MNRLLIVVLLFLGLFMCTVAPTEAQDTEPADTNRDSITTVDTLLFDPGDRFSQAAPVTATTNFEEHLSQNPTTGMLKSMAIPGWGQLGNNSWIKALLFAGLDAWFIASAIHYGNKAGDLFDQYEATPTDSVALRLDLYDQYSDQRDQRNKYTWFAVFTTLASMVDAYVDAHLSGYPSKKLGENISLSLEPDFRDETVLASLSLRF